MFHWQISCQINWDIVARWKKIPHKFINISLKYGEIFFNSKIFYILILPIKIKCTFSSKLNHFLIYHIFIWKYWISYNVSFSQIFFYTFCLEYKYLFVILIIKSQLSFCLNLLFYCIKVYIVTLFVDSKWEIIYIYKAQYIQ